MPKILIIDDEPDVIEFQKSYLSKRKYEVLVAANTPQAIEALKNESPDVTFCDLRLETDTTGLVIIEQAKKLNPGLVIYLITGMLDKEIEEQALSLGAKEILHKPLTNEQLEQKIKQVVAG